MGKRKTVDTMSDAGFTQIFNCSQGVKWSLMFIEVFFISEEMPKVYEEADEVQT